MDRLFAEAANEPDEAKRRDLYKQVQRIVADEVALAWLVEMQWPTIHSAKLKNVVRNGLGPNDNFAEAYFEE